MNLINLKNIIPATKEVVGQMKKLRSQHLPTINDKAASCLKLKAVYLDLLPYETWLEYDTRLSKNMGQLLEIAKEIR